jgi:DNA modification methylase
MAIVSDLRTLHGVGEVESRVHYFDSRRETGALPPESIDAVITSPPYPNEKDYTRTTRLESVILGFIRNKAELKTFKRSLMRSNTRNVFKDDDDDRWVSDHPEVLRLAAEIESRRIALGKTSGFERLYPRVTRLYFGGLARHLSALRKCLRPGARLAYVVGDQASYLRVMIRTGAILADIAKSLGYELVGVDLFRTRLATATKEQLREEVVFLRWPGLRTHG